jgi:hypothetical protein
MIRYFRALAWLRWHLVVNSLRPTRRRDALERASRAFQVLGPILVFLFFIPGILMMGALGLGAGWYLSSTGTYLAPVLVVLRIVLVFEFILTLLAPLLRATQGAPLNLTRFLLLPIPARFLYIGEAFSAFGDPWLAILTSALAGLALGWLAGGTLPGALLVLSAGASMIALLTGLGALSSAFTHLVFRDRRRGEMVSMVLLLVLALGGMMPGLFSTFQPERKRSPDALKEVEKREARGAGSSPEGAAPGRGWDGRALPAWAPAYPPELYVRCVALASERRAAPAFPALAILALWAAGIHLVASRIYGRLMETPEVQSAPRMAEAFTRWTQVPGLSPAVSAVAVAEVKLIFRTVQGKISYCLMPAVVVLMGVLWRRRPGELDAHIPFPFGVVLALAGVVFALLSLEPVTLNQFAMDRAGLTLEFLSPLSNRELIRGKAAGAAILGGSRALLCYVAALLVAPGGSPFHWLAVLAAGAAIFFVLAPCGAILSTVFPKAMDVGRIGQAGKPHPLASFLGMLCIALGAGPAVLLGLLGLIILQSPALTFFLVVGWALLAAAISVPLFRVAEKSLARRRENLALVAQGR